MTDPGYIDGEQFLRHGMIYTVTDVWATVRPDGEVCGRYVIARPIGRTLPASCFPADLVIDAMLRPDDPNDTA